MPQENEIIIRPMEEKDIPQVESIERASFPSPWTSRLFYLEIKKKNFAYYHILEFKGKVVGYIGYWKVHDEAHIVTFAVHPLYRRKGFGKALLNYVLEEAKKRGIKRATLEVRETNYAAQKLYEKVGFKKVAIRPGYYHDTGENAVIYWKNF
ncbi:MAG TPA: ribosomal-protein-alanine N-acetyltransferase [Candidatus Aerophobetes bacterium]|uniref:[Ribosomal protein bS18]-alanine N-acetyltransferase n=1 Tax=Aerophobetes bacterium TaxID=2030807 RepID=A0A7V5HZR9_UNCAE|nr:ribosomal-protein-alanine N-acetyltransferase [Candidatus Aerophobetes bacterium]